MSAASGLFVNDLLRALPDGGRVLDLGCGPGSFRYGLFPALRITALDLTQPPEASSWPAHVTFQQGAAEALPLPGGSFDLVIANFVFEHTRSFERAIEEAARVLVPGGSLYLSVPNAKSFEDHLYRALFAGGGHRQQFGLESILRTVYAHTTLKLMAFADWPAGFTFFEGREGLRQFTLALVDAIHRSTHTDPMLRSNVMMAFRKGQGTGYRSIERVCSYCGGGNVERLPDEATPRWHCRTCGRTTESRDVSLADLDRLQAEMADLWARHPHPWSGGTARIRRPRVPRLRPGWLARVVDRLRGRR